MALPPEDLPWLDLDQAPRDALDGLRIGLNLDCGVRAPVEPEVAAAIARAARSSSVAAGATCGGGGP